MARTLSTMMPLGTEAPDFSLPATSGTMVHRDDFRGKRGLLVMFICNHCPYVKHVRSQLGALAEEYQAQELGVVAIMSNDTESYPDDNFEAMEREVAEQGYTFSYCLDGDQSIAKAYGAACTPDFFLFDRDFRLFYRGQLDESRPKNDIPVSGIDLRNALNALLAGDAPPEDQKPSLGCNIKWKPGNEPDYYQTPH